MLPVELRVVESRGVDRKGYVVEQGVPVSGLSRDDVLRLAVFDVQGKRIPASVHPEGFDQHDNVRWVLVSFAVDVAAGEEQRFSLNRVEGPVGPAGLQAQETEAGICISNGVFDLRLDQPGAVQLRTPSGVVLDGALTFKLRSDARSAVGNLRPVEFQPSGFRLLEHDEFRARVLLTGSYVGRKPKAFELDASQRYDVEAEFVVHFGSPAVRFRWRINNRMRFNCSYMWLDRYLICFPLAEAGGAAHGDVVPGEDYFQSSVFVRTPGGSVAVTAPFSEWLGAGAGIEVCDGFVRQGGVKPPPDGGFGGLSPDIHRKFFNGMSRTFEGSIVVDANASQVLSELRPLPIIVPAQHYSDCGELPEGGSSVTPGPWQAQIDRAAQWLLDTQWKGTLWFGEWWREIDIDHDLGIEETNSGNSALAPLYHFYRTGDWRFWQCARMAYLYTYDLQFCKSEDNDGPYMHTRRFLLDHQEWFHPRYQRVGGILKPSHLFGDSQAREKVYWMLRYWGEHYFDEDGCPLVPNRQGGRDRVDERAMSIIGDSMAQAYVETGDGFFLDIAKRVGDWVVSSLAREDWETIAENSNSTRYILQGLLPLCSLTDDRKYRDTYVKTSTWTLDSPRFDFGTHYVAFHFHLACQAFRMTGDTSILEDILDLAKWVLCSESQEHPGTYPFVQHGQYPPARWICSYDNIAITAYLPVLASTLAEAGIPAS